MLLLLLLLLLSMLLLLLCRQPDEARSGHQKKRHSCYEQKARQTMQTVVVNSRKRGSQGGVEEEEEEEDDAGEDSIAGHIGLPGDTHKVVCKAHMVALQRRLPHISRLRSPSVCFGEWTSYKHRVKLSKMQKMDQWKKRERERVNISDLFHLPLHRTLDGPWSTHVLQG
jgi:hypothetical protein